MHPRSVIQPPAPRRHAHHLPSRLVPQVQQAVRANYMQGYEITENMRALLVDWLVQVHSRFQLLQETLYLTVAILDRFLQVRAVRTLCVWVW